MPSHQSIAIEMSLKECYARVRGLAHNLDELDVVEEVERYRTFWKPDRVRVLLLAESHVRTNHGDFAHRWSYGKDPVYEGNFVRFVYCFAYGERSLVNIPSNKGTWQLEDPIQLSSPGVRESGLSTNFEEFHEGPR